MTNGLLPDSRTGFHDVEAATGVDFEVFDGADDGGGYGHLGCEVQHELGATDRVQQGKRVVTNIALDEVAVGGELLAEIAEVEVGAFTPQVVEDNDVPAIANESLSSIYSNESSATSDKDCFLCQARPVVQRFNLTQEFCGDSD